MITVPVRHHFDEILKQPCGVGVFRESEEPLFLLPNFHNGNGLKQRKNIFEVYAKKFPTASATFLSTRTI